MAKEKIAVIGLGHFGHHLCLDLVEKGAEVVAIDMDEDKVETLRDKASYVLCMDSTDKEALESAGITDMDRVIVAIGEAFESSLMTIAHLQEFNVKQIIGRVISPVHERLLQLMGIEDRILPEQDAARTLAKKLTTSGLVASTEIAPGYSMAEVGAPEFVVGKTLSEINLRQTYQLNLVTIKQKISKKSSLITRGEKEQIKVIGVPDKNYRIDKEDTLILFGEDKYIQRFMEN